MRRGWPAQRRGGFGDAGSVCRGGVKVTDKGGVEVKLIDRIRALEALYGLLSEEKAEGAGELYRVLTEAAGEEGGWDDG